VFSAVRCGEERKKFVEKEKALELALSQIEKQFGRGSIMRLGQQDRPAIAAISTGALALDIALGVGGLPRGRVTEIYGPEASGKTTLGLTTIAEAQKAGGVAAIVDAEHALDAAYARALGIDLERLLVSQPGTGEEALEITDALVRSGAVDVIVVDSVAALVPKAEIEGEMGQSLPGIQARLMSQGLRKLTGNVSRANCVCIFINQLREKIGVMFGNPETQPGGKALKFYSSVRLDVRRIETLKNGTNMVGSRTRVKVVKNKVAPPFRQAEFDIMFGHGISRAGGILDLGVEMGLVAKAGAFFSWDDGSGSLRLGQGRENAKEFLDSRPDVAQAIEARIRAQAAGADNGGGAALVDEEAAEAAA
jgi:recombination protein RecA